MGSSYLSYMTKEEWTQNGVAGHLYRALLLPSHIPDTPSAKHIKVGGVFGYPGTE